MRRPECLCDYNIYNNSIYDNIDNRGFDFGMIFLVNFSGSSDNCLLAHHHNHHQWRQQHQHPHQIGHNLSSLLGLPETGSMTCLDLQAQEVQDTRKMRDDSKIHHIVEDSIFKPRKVVSACVE